MGNTTGAPAGQAPADAQPQAGTTTSGQEPPAGSGQAPAAGTASGTTGDAATGGETAEQKVERLERELAETRREAAGHRTKAQTLEREKQARDAEGQTAEQRAAAEAQALRDENAALKSEAAASRLATATTEVATKLGYRNPSIAHKLIDPSAITYNDEGKATNLESLLRTIATAEPYLTTAAGQDFGGGNRGGQAAGTAEPGMNELLHAAIKGR